MIYEPYIIIYNNKLLLAPDGRYSTNVFVQLYVRKAYLEKYENFKCRYTVLNLLCKSFRVIHFYCLYCINSRADDCRPLGVLIYLCSDFGFELIVGKFTSANVICKNQWHKVFARPLSATERPIQTHQHSRKLRLPGPCMFCRRADYSSSHNMNMFGTPEGISNTNAIKCSTLYK